MSELNSDMLFLIFEELQYDRNSLFSCLLVNKTWCEVIIPMLWKKPWTNSWDKGNSLFNVIISHLSNEAKENLRNQGIDLSALVQWKPLFNYVSFCNYIELSLLEQWLE